MRLAHKIDPPKQVRDVTLSGYQVQGGLFWPCLIYNRSYTCCLMRLAVLSLRGAATIRHKGTGCCCLTAAWLPVMAIYGTIKPVTRTSGK